MLFKVVALISSLAFSAPQVTPIQADFVCVSGASQYSFKMTPSQEKIWVSAPKATEGIPLNVVEILRAKCPGCYSVKADWDNGTFEFTISGTAQAGANQIKVVSAGHADDPDAVTKTSAGVCTPAK